MKKQQVWRKTQKVLCLQKRPEQPMEISTKAARWENKKECENEKEKKMQNMKKRIEGNFNHSDNSCHSIGE